MIFLSFSSEDRDAARCLAAGLTAAEVAVWCTAMPGTIAKGRRPEMEVPAAIARCSAFAVLAVRTEFSHWVLDEIAAARRRLRKEPAFPLVPLLGPNVDPAALPITITNFEGLQLPLDPRSMSADHFTALARELRGLLPAAAPAVAEAVSSRLIVPAPLGIARPTPLLDMVRIPAGKFFMGSAKSAFDDERPVHEVRVAAFDLARTPVTRTQWLAVMSKPPEGASWKSGSGGNLPATEITWDEAVEFCGALTKLDGFEERGRYRLPSESEWEYACRAGTSTEYSFGDDAEHLARHAWYFVNSGIRELSPTTDWSVDKVQGEWACRPRPVGEKPANQWGLFDMHGNVWEWCEDAWHDSYRGAPSDSRAWAEPASELRVIRGGSFGLSAERARSAFRGRPIRSLRWTYVGFRPARSVTTD